MFFLDTGQTMEIPEGAVQKKAAAGSETHTYFLENAAVIRPTGYSKVYI